MAFNCSFEEYMKNVYSQLDDNTSDEYKKEYVTFMYDEKYINEHINYFKKTYSENMSAYMALNFLYYEKENNICVS